MSLVSALQASLAAASSNDSEVIAQLLEAWRSDKCICGEDKWPNYPLCRICTIRAKRVGLLWMSRGIFGSQLNGVASDMGGWTRRWARDYDRARDFAFVVHTFGKGEIQHGKEEDEEGQFERARSGRRFRRARKA